MSESVGEPFRASDGPAGAHWGRLCERTFTCPYCWEQISVLLDPSVAEQTYVEDCEVCCRPLRIHYAMKKGAIVRFDVRPAA